MKTLEDLKEMLEAELKKITRKGDITPTELENTYKVIDIIKDIGEITKYEEDKKSNYSTDGYSERGYSRDGGMSRDGNYSMNTPMYSRYMPMGYDRMPYSMDMGTSYAGRRGRDGDSDGRYSEDDGGSYARRQRDSRGRYSRDGNSYDGEPGYSSHSKKERMIEKLESMMDSVSNDHERRAIERCIEELER